MSLPTSLIRCAALLLACGAVPALAAETDSSVMYRCPGNDYKNTITAKEAEKLGCKRIEGAPVTVIQMTKPRPSCGFSSSALLSSATKSIPTTGMNAIAKLLLRLRNLYLIS